MYKLILIVSAGLILSACQTNYITSDGKRLLENSAVGCVAGEILFGECAKGAAVGAGATVISDQKKN
tara:strand:- start:15883 stop:16083 length:201 start_codon:yes stop_codon:yes gene_type:complete